MSFLGLLGQALEFGSTPNEGLGSTRGLAVDDGEVLADDWRGRAELATNARALAIEECHVALSPAGERSITLTFSGCEVSGDLVEGDSESGLCLNHAERLAHRVGYD